MDDHNLYIYIYKIKFIKLSIQVDFDIHIISDGFIIKDEK